MALISHPNDPTIVYDLPMAIINDLSRIGRWHGLARLVNALENYRPYTRALGDREPMTFQQLAARDEAPTAVAGGFDDDFLAAIRPTRRKKAASEEPLETLKTPIIDELNEDGSKKLYKTRYTELEKKYVNLHSRFAEKQREAAKLQSDNEKMADQNYKLSTDLQQAKALTVDGDRVNKMIDRLCKETGIVIVNDDFRGLTVDQRIERFLGTILCRIRTEVVADELAD